MVKVSTPYSGSVTYLPGGSFNPVGGTTFRLDDKPRSGDFSVSLPKRVPVRKGAAAAGGGIKRLAGTYRTSVDGTYDLATGTGQTSGTQVLRLRPARLGIACVTFSSEFSDRGLSETGTFALAGGTKAAKTIRFAGTFTQTAEATVTGTAAVTGRLKGKVKFNKSPRGLSQECKALRAQLP